MSSEHEGPNAKVRSLVLVGAFVVVLLTPLSAAGATSWAVRLASGSAGQSESLTVSTPSLSKETCVSSNGNEVTITWKAQSGATSYSLFDSSTSGGTYTSYATGLTGTSVTLALATGTYYFKLEALYGDWTSGLSSVSKEITIGSSSCSVA